MKIKDLVKILNEHPNKEAEIIIRYNSNSDNDEDSDIICNYLEVFNIDKFYFDFLEIFSTKK
jgi:hypothetical protein